MKHYIVMSGMSGCIPDNVQSFFSKFEAVKYIEDIFDLPKEKALCLRKKGYVALGNDFGADYAEINKCNCSNPKIHDDN
jgi:hypothetical protein